MEVGLVQKIDIENELQQSYLDYAMSVIVSRALPDARDGLKPVHRRILFSMFDMGLRPDTPFKKSARIVGEVMGKYHPHGDMAVYDAMARMAQDFSMRYMLVTGQGNFGSMDGDPPAAMRYTEARLADPAMHMLADIEKNAVDFDENFDGTLSEPTVLPSAIPNMLVNGATGIAVGMATSIPPHNLVEVVNALEFMLQKWNRLDDVTVEDLMQFIKGPDFPTGGIILQGNEAYNLLSSYSTGRGRVAVRASVHFEEMSRGRNRIIITELPYMTNKSTLIERIASLVRDEKIEGIADLRDESDRQGMRIVIELYKKADPQAVLRNLYKSTPLQNTFSLIMLALVNGEPRLLSLKQALRVYLEHRLEIVRRRSKFDLARAEKRAHILEGLLVALKNLDEVIDIIRRSHNVTTASKNLRKRFKLSLVQAQAILDMPLRRLASLERKKIDEEYRSVRATIRKFKSLLRSPKTMREIVSNELQNVKESYGDRRRTQIAQLEDGKPDVTMLTTTDLTPEKTVWLVQSKEGKLSRTRDIKMPRISGKNAPSSLIQVNTRDTLYLVDKKGVAAAIPVHAVPETNDSKKGLSVQQITPFNGNIKLAGMFSLPPKDQMKKQQIEGWYVLTATQEGMVKKSSLGELPGPSAGTFTLVKVNDGDALGWIRLTHGKDEMLLMTAGGMSIRFGEDQIRPMGLVAAGVMGIKLHKDDVVIGTDIVSKVGDVLMVASDGSGKRVALKDFPSQGRHGQGVQSWKLPSKVKVVGMTIARGTYRVILHTSRLAPKAVRLDSAALLGRTARGRKILKISTNERVTMLISPERRFFK
ncbi:MAG: DNA gyrase subunit A [Chloroflexota bacterium]|nr:DNA gyrase subunit A [Chloroflexota bacterium]